jgi:hypothetical protein
MRYILLILASVFGTMAQSQSMETIRLANDMGTLLGSEKVCNLTYNQDAITMWIDVKVPPEDMSFASALSMMTESTAYGLQDISESARTAHCRSIERTAKHYGFIE